MKLTLNLIERVEGKSFSLLALNLQDALILDDNGEVLGMIHLGHKTARLFPSSLTIGEIDLWLMDNEFEIQDVATSFALAERTKEGYSTCGEIIYLLKQ